MVPQVFRYWAESSRPRALLTILDPVVLSEPFAVLSCLPAPFVTDILWVSHSFAYIAGTNETPLDSPPAHVGSSFESSTGIAKDSESAIVCCLVCHLVMFSSSCSACSGPSVSQMVTSSRAGSTLMAATLQLLSFFHIVGASFLDPLACQMIGVCLIYRSDMRWSSRAT
jgi:hypothetical protein